MANNMENDRISGAKKAKNKPDSAKEVQESAPQDSSSVKDLSAELKKISSKMLAILNHEDNIPIDFYDKNRVRIIIPGSNEGDDFENFATSVVYASLRDPDSERELETLISFISVDRMSEEMDDRKYLESAKKTFSRISLANKKLSKLIASNKKEVIDADSKSEEIWFSEISTDLKNVHDKITDIEEKSFDKFSESDKRLFSEIKTKFNKIQDFFKSYIIFCKHIYQCTKRAEYEFNSRELYEAFEQQTRRHAKTLKKQTLINSKWPFLVGLISAIILLILFYLPNDSIIDSSAAVVVSAIVFLLSYLVSYVFGNMARIFSLRKVRSFIVELYRRIFGTYVPDQKHLVRHASESTLSSVDINRGLKFISKRNFGKYEFAHEVDGLQRFYDNEWPELKADTNQFLADSLAKSERRWCFAKWTMRFANLALLIIALPFFTAWIAHIWADSMIARPLMRGDNVQIETRRPDLGGAVIYKGLLYDSSSVVLLIKDPACGAITRIERDSIVSMRAIRQEPADLAITSPFDRMIGVFFGRMGHVDSEKPCSTPEMIRNTEPSRLRFESALEVRQDQSLILGALTGLAESLKNGLGQISGSIEAQSQRQQVITLQLPPAACPVAETFGSNVPRCSPNDRAVFFLPLFPGPVTGSTGSTPGETYGRDGINQPPEAFYFGQSDLKDPEVESASASGGGRVTLIQSIAHSMRACMAATKAAYARERRTDIPENYKLRLTVFGFASETRFRVPESISAEQRDRLNHFLAEGRRLAVIRQLRTVFGNDQAIVIEKEPAYSTRRFSSVDDLTAQRIADGFQFRNFAEMQAELNRWVRLPSPMPDSTHGHPTWSRESLARSVMIRVDSDALLHCGQVR